MAEFDQLYFTLEGQDSTSIQILWPDFQALVTAVHHAIMAGRASKVDIGERGFYSSDHVVRH